MAKNELEPFMGQAVTGEGGKLNVDKDGRRAILESLEVTRDVQKLLKKAQRTIAINALDYIGPKCVKSKEQVRLSVGAGSEMTTFTMTPEKEVRNPTTGEKITAFGVFSIHEKGVAPGDAEFVTKQDAYREQLKKALKK